MTATPFSVHSWSTLISNHAHSSRVLHCTVGMWLPVIGSMLRQYFAVGGAGGAAAFAADNGIAATTRLRATVSILCAISFLQLRVASALRISLPLVGPNQLGLRQRVTARF